MSKYSKHLSRFFMNVKIVVKSMNESLRRVEMESTNKNTNEDNMRSNNSVSGPTYPGWDKLLHLTDDNYESIFRQHRDIFIMFHAKWCGRCATIKPIFSELALNLEKSVATPPLLGENTNTFNSIATLAACDVDSSPSLVNKLQIIVIPTFKYVRNGEAIRKYGGEETKEGVLEFLKRMKDVNRKM